MYSMAPPQTAVGPTAAEGGQLSNLAWIHIPETLTNGPELAQRGWSGASLSWDSASY